MSYWSVPVRRVAFRKILGSDVHPREVEIIKTAADLLNKAYGSVHLITDSDGKEKLKSIEWATVDTSLDVLPKEGYFRTWSLGKLKAYNIISQRGEPFLHVDGDFFINQRLPADVEAQPIIFERKDYASPERNYVTESFRKYCLLKHLTAPVEKCIPIESDENCFNTGILPDYAYNCGIVGGTDLDFFFNYSESSLKTIFDPTNNPFFTLDLPIRKKIYHPNTENWTLAILAEQYYAAIVAKAMNKAPYFLENLDEVAISVDERIKKWVEPVQISTNPGNFKWLHLQGACKLRYEEIFHNNQ